MMPNFSNINLFLKKIEPKFLKFRIYRQGSNFFLTGIENL